MINQCTKFEVSRFSSYEMQKMGLFGAVRGHSQSWAMPLFDRAHTHAHTPFFWDYTGGLVPER